MTTEDIEERLARLARQTASLRPSREFSRRTMLAIHAEAALGFRSSLSRVAQRFVPVALIFALGAVVWAVASEREATLQMARSFAAPEYEW